MSAIRKASNRNALLVVLNLYHKLTFWQLHHRNPAIIALAEKLGRGAYSVAMKLNNLLLFSLTERAQGDMIDP